ncbi:hypothetical protein [Micromonospora sp. NPDC023888]|uniref:hypothetical protein n=1 Tax=Micromonospora sp. NPDC023888 TaxID=3155607 RepID=UPI0033E11F54
MEGRTYLEKFVADRLAADHGQPLEGHRLMVDRSEVRGVAMGLVAAGALAQEEMERILAELDQKLERRGRLTRVEMRTSAESGVSPQWVPLSAEARQQLVLQHGRERAQWREPVADPAQLREVIPLVDRTPMRAGVPATLISLERWSTMFVLRLAYAGMDARDPGSLVDSMQVRLKRWRGWDDAGTQYRSRCGSAERRGGLVVETVVFEPGAPDEARTLTLAFDNDGGAERLTVALDGRTTPA